MSDFSVEMAVERIADPRTRQYFEEVSRSYSAGNYRSAVVMLWSVVICDLLFKLDQLANAYGDATARSILDEIEKARLGNPRSPEWESLLLDKIKARTQLLHEADYANLQHLQTHRHLSAHPVLTDAEALFSPSKEATRSHIRSALEGVLTKPAIMTKKVFDALVEDLEEIQDSLPDRKSVKRYLEAKYFPHFITAVEDAVFRSLWQIVFKVPDERCEKNRDINYYALCVLYERRPQEVNRLIEGNRVHYSRLHFSGKRFALLLAFLRDHPKVYNLLGEEARVPIDNHVKTSLDRFSTAWYLSESFEQHLAEINRRVREQNQSMRGVRFKKVCEAARDHGCFEKVLEVGIELYGRSESYDAADERFDGMIRPYLPEFSEGHLEMLLKLIEDNGQTCDRRKAKTDHREVMTVVERVMNEKFRPKNYPNFSESIGLAK